LGESVLLVFLGKGVCVFVGVGFCPCFEVPV
jgi:hypothetical protein